MTVFIVFIGLLVWNQRRFFFNWLPTYPHISSNIVLLYVMLDSYHILSVFSVSMEQSPSLEGNNCSSSREIPRFLLNPKVHCRVHKSPSSISFLSQLNSIYTHASYFFNIHFNEVIGFFKWPNPSSRTMALGSTHPLAGMSTRNLPGSKGRPACGSLDVSQPYGPSWPVRGIGLPFSPFTPLSPKWPSFRFSDSNCVCISHLPQCVLCIPPISFPVISSP
jgi:hypothetical protein